jgi:ribosome-binding factor A
METEQMTGLEAALKYNEICYNVSKEVKKFINIVRRMEINDEKLQMCSRYMDKHDADVYLPVISEGIGKLVALQNYLKGLKK